MRDAGSDVNLLYLMADTLRTNEDDLEHYKEEYDVMGLGFNKGAVAEDGDDGYIHSVDGELIQRVSHFSRQLLLIFKNGILLIQVHAAGLEAVLYTFKNEYDYLPWDFGQDPHMEYESFLDLGIDGFFTDFPGSLHMFYETKRTQQLLEDSQETTTTTATSTTFSTTASTTDVRALNLS